MKKSIFLFSVIAMLFSFSNMSAQKKCCTKAYEHTSCKKSCNKTKTSFKAEKGAKSTSFKVAGQCEMCKARIEKAAIGVKGVKTANWDKTSKLLSVTYNGDVKKKNIEKAIANIGHDTPDFKASSDVYNSLPECCKYK